MKELTLKTLIMKKQLILVMISRYSKVRTLKSKENGLSSRWLSKGTLARNKYKLFKVSAS